MSYLWICLSLVCAASFLPSSSSDKDVSVTCNPTVEVAAEDRNVTLNCTLFILDKRNCRFVGYVWRNTTAHNLCKADHECDCDSMTYVSLTILPVEENYTVSIQATCGDDEAFVRVIKPRTGEVKHPPKPPSGPEIIPALMIPALMILVLAVVGAILFRRRFGSNRDREMFKCIKEEKTQEDMLTNTWKDDEKRQCV